MEKNTNKQRNRICVCYIERTSVGNTERCSVCLYSVVLCWVRVRMRKYRKMGDLSDFERWQIVGGRLASASVTNTATLLGISRATVSKVMWTYTNHGKTTSAKKNSWRRSTTTERNRLTLRRIVCKTLRTTAAEPNIHLEDPVSTRTVRRELHKYNIHGRVALALGMKIFHRRGYTGSRLKIKSSNFLMMM
jgi:predicted transcriptional regulator